MLNNKGAPVTSVQVQVDLFTGSSRYIFPLSVTSARDLTPAIALTYRSGGGDSTFGFGFDLPIAKIYRSTVQGIPVYDDDQDTFILSGEEKLIKKDAIVRTRKDGDYQVTLFQPYASEKIRSIEHWQTKDKSQDYWLVRDDNGVNHIFGKQAATKIIDPTETSHVFCWLLEQSYDAKGNKIVYDYDQEPNEPNRYLTSIRYGNYTLNPHGSSKEGYAFQIKIDYSKRENDLISYRSGFPLKTQRLCQRISLHHQFDSAEFLVKQWACSYQPDKLIGVMLLSQIQETGFRKLQKTEEILHKSLPPVSFEYHPFHLRPDFANNVLQFSEPLISPGLGFYQFVDLYHEGLPGILYSDLVSSYYWRNTGNGHFAAPELLGQFPNARNLISFKNRLMDIPGNDQLAFVVAERQYGGYYESLEQGEWKNFQPFEKYPLDFTHPAAEFIDLDHRGMSDLVMINAIQACYYPALGKQGFDTARPLTLPNDFPVNAASDVTQLVTFANILGDGLLHRVRITRNKVEYWPNLGQGKFGAKQEIAKAPVFDENFDASRIFLINVKDNGATDLLYVDVEQNTIKIYSNFYGQQFATTSIDIALPVPFTRFDRIQIADVFGKGTPCLVLTKMDADIKHYYYDFAPEQKPYLLFRIDNNCGASTEVTYSSSMQVYLEDVNNHRAALHKNHMPVPVVDTLIMSDQISDLQFMRRYKFHDGYYDPFEREFCGFGFVEQWEGALSKKPAETDVPPHYTKCWYYNGRPEVSDGLTSPLSHPYAMEFYQGDKNAQPLADSQCVLPNQMHAPEIDKMALQRQAYFVLQGRVLRQEVYGLDDGPLAIHPYTIIANNYNAVCLQWVSPVQRGTFLIQERESMTYHYERNPADPRIIHQLNLEWDAYNQPLKSCEVYYPRREQTTSSENPYRQLCLQPQEEQMTGKIMGVQRQLLNKPAIATEEDDFQWLGFPLQTQRVVIVPPAFDVTHITVETIQKFFPADISTLPEDNLLKWKKHYYWDAKRENVLDNNDVNQIGAVQCLLLHHQEQFVASEKYLEQCYSDNLFKDKLAELSTTLEQQAGYLLQKNDWWQSGLVTYYHDAESFYLPKSVKSLQSAEEHPLWSKTDFTYDPHGLVLIKSQRYLYDSTTHQTMPITVTEVMATDPYTLLPLTSKDANGTITERLIDPLGVVVASSRYGEVNNTVMGNRPLDEALLSLLTKVTLTDVVQHPENYLAQAGQIVVYEVSAWANKRPNWTLVVDREQWQQFLPVFIDETPTERFPMTISYHNGLGEEIQTKVKAGPGKALTLTSTRQVQEQEQEVEERWQTSGQVKRNNLGLPAEEYLPFYADHVDFTDQTLFISSLPNPTCVYYDALQRIITTKSPQGFSARSEFAAWYSIEFDVNDTSSITQYADTPTIQLFDVLASPFITAEVEKQDKTVKLLKTKTHYNTIGQLVALQDPRLPQPNIIYQRDKLNQIIAQDSVDSGRKVKLYNVYSNVIQQWNGRQFMFHFEYDNWQRPLSKQVEGPGISTHVYEKIIYGDLTKDAAAQNRYGKIITYYDQAGVLLFHAFDINGRCLQAERQLFKLQPQSLMTSIDWKELDKITMPSESFVNEARYNALGRPLQQKQIDGSIVLSQDTPTAQLAQLRLQLPGQAAPKHIIDDIQYLATGKRSLFRYGNGIEIQFEYEKDSQRLAKWQTHHPATQKTFQDMGYGYDPIGNITELDDRSFQALFPDEASMVPASAQHYDYDSLYRLQKATGKETDRPKGSVFTPETSTAKILQSLLHQEKVRPYEETYAYDEGNNLILQKHGEEHIEYDIAAASNRVQQVEATNQKQTYAYDEVGNLKTLDQQTQLQWDHKNQLIYLKKIKEDVIIEEFYQYDATQQRTRKLTRQGNSNEIIEHLYLSNYEIIRTWQLSAANELTLVSERKALRLFEGKQCIATCYVNQVTGATGQLIYSLNNHLRSVVAEVDEQAELLTYEEYLPFGESTFIIGKDSPSIQAKQYHYSGKERDEISQLYYYGARYYAQSLGRWIATDPLEFVDGLNVYGFVGNDPVKYIDIAGEQILYLKILEGKIVSNDDYLHGVNVPQVFKGVFESMPHKEKIFYEEIKNSNLINLTFSIHIPKLNSIMDYFRHYYNYYFGHTTYASTRFLVEYKDNKGTEQVVSLAGGGKAQFPGGVNGILGYRAIINIYDFDNKIGIRNSHNAGSDAFLKDNILHELIAHAHTYLKFVPDTFAKEETIQKVIEKISAEQQDGGLLSQITHHYILASERNSFYEQTLCNMMPEKVEQIKNWNKWRYENVLNSYNEKLNKRLLFFTDDVKKLYYKQPKRNLEEASPNSRYNNKRTRIAK